MRNRLVKGKRLGIAILAIALAALLVATSCAPPPIIAEQKTAQFGWIVALTGGGAAPAQIMFSGGQDCIRHFNEQEAIPGVSVELLWRDSGLQFALARSHYERFFAAGVPVMSCEESSLLRTVRGTLERDGVVMFTAGGGFKEIVYPDKPGWIYTISPTISEQVAVVLQYFMENWKEERPPRLALVSIDISFGLESRYVTEYARSLGFEVLPPETVPIVVLDSSVLLLRLKEAGADLVHIQGLAEASGPILRDADRLGLLDQMQFAGHSSAMGERVIQLTGVASEGFLVSRPYPWFSETEVPGIKLMLDNMMKYHGEVRRNAEYFTGWIETAVVCEAIRRAIDNAGYENLDGPAIKEALDGMKDFDVYGLASVTYKSDDYRGVTKMAVYEVRDGEIVRVSDWREAPSGRDWEYKW